MVAIAVRVAACAVTCGVALTGCASPGGGASTHNDVSRCAAVLPAARDLVRGQGRLVLVRPVRQTDIDTIVKDATRPAAPVSSQSVPAPPAPVPPAPVPPASATPGTSHRAPARHAPVADAPAGHAAAAHRQGGHPGTPGWTPRLCLIAYQGDFRADTITGAGPAGASGQYVLIFLWVRHPSPDRILITNVLPASAHRPWWHF